MGEPASAGSVCLVVPCFNEQARLRTADFAELVTTPGVAVLFVDDGSTDGTLAMVRQLAATTPAIDVVHLEHNGGKGEAVRHGLVRALQTDVAWVGYIDADLATPVTEVVRLIEVASTRPGIDAVIGARVALLGRHITRSAVRHYTGRVFATLASVALATAVYDTQNGAKLFRCSDALARSLDEPFHSRWAFDVELLGRLAGAGVPTDAFWEEPLLAWRDVPGSKRSLRSSVRATAELWPIWTDLRRRRNNPDPP